MTKQRTYGAHTNSVYSSKTGSQSRQRSKSERLASTLFDPLPRSLSEAARRVRPVSMATIRSRLVAMIEREELTAWEGDRLSPLFKVIGVHKVSERLVSLTEPHRPEDQRAQAFAALFHSPRGQALFNALTEQERISLCEPWVRPMMSLAVGDSFPRFALAALCEATPSLYHVELVSRFERCRREVEGCLVSAYEVIFKRGSLSEQSLELLFDELTWREFIEELPAVITESSPLVTAVYKRVKTKRAHTEAS